MAMYRRCVCLELIKLKSPLKCRRAVRKNPHVIIAGVLLSFRRLQSRTHGTQSPNIAGAATAGKFLRHAQTQLAASVTQFFCRVYEV